jgi:ketosteroid isomerase-like protein
MPDKEIIRKQIEEWAEAVRAKEIGRITAGHSDNILLFDVVEPLQLRGIDAYKASWEKQFFPWYGEDGTFELHDLEVHAGVTAAFCTSLITCSGTENGKKVQFTIRLTVGLEKVNGKWIVMHEHHSEPLPIPNQK